MQPVSDDAKEIFLNAIERHSPEQWSAYLDGACRQDPSLRERVELLLAAHRKSDEFLDQQPPTVGIALDEPIGSTIGPFKLLQRIGEGGFGVVYMAEQAKPIRRKVALKIIKPGMDSKEVIARFEAERQALALMDHPNIAKVLDAGATDSGRPYFAMELVKGVSITEYADQNHLTTDDRLRLFASVCRAVHHAHQKGVIHRDLKPSNVMVTLHDGKPVAKVIDFGVSKAISQPMTEKTLFTRYGQVIGTPQYMSPEQAEMSGLDIDTRSDVYSLGVMLYELLTGQTPFLMEQIRVAGFDEMRRMIREDEPARPSNRLQTLDDDTATVVANNRSSRPESLRKSVCGELDWIVMQTISKDRNHRYDSASSLADDIDRHLNDEPVEASPPSIRYRMLKTYRRNRMACLTGSLVLGTLSVGMVVSFLLMLESNRNADMAKLAEARAVRAKQEAEANRDRADGFASKAAEEAVASQHTLDLMVRLLSQIGTNPRTGLDYTVKEALSLLALPDSKTQQPRMKDSDSAIPVKPASLKLPPRVAATMNFALGRAHDQAGNADFAIVHFQKALKANRILHGESSLPVAACLRQLGFALGSDIELDQAITIARNATSNTDLTSGLTLYGNLLVRRGTKQDLAKAEKNYLEACKLYEPFPSVELNEIPFMGLARLYRETGNTEASLKYQGLAIQTGIDQFGNDINQWLNRGKYLRKQKKYDDSEYALLIANFLYDGQSDDEPGLHLALNYLDTGRLNLAEESFRKNIERAKPKKRYGRIESCSNGLAKTLIALGRNKEAFDVLLSPSMNVTSITQENLCRMLVIGIEDNDSALRLVGLREQLIEVKDKSRTDHAASLLAILDAFEGNVDQCIERLQGKHLATAGLYIGLLSRGHFDRAARLTHHSMLVDQARNDSYHASWNIVRIARTHYHIGDLEAGERHLREAIRLSEALVQGDPYSKKYSAQNYWLSRELALLLAAQGNANESREFMTKTLRAISESRRWGETLWSTFFDRIAEWKCRIESGTGYEPDAMHTNLRTLFQKATTNDEKSAVYSLMGLLYDQQGNSIKAIEAYEQEALLRPLDFQVLPCLQFEERLVELYMENNKPERGQEFFEKLIAKRDAGLGEKHPRRAFARIHLARLLLKMEGRLAEAKERLLEAKNIMSQHEMTPEHVHATIAELLQQAEDAGA